MLDFLLADPRRDPRAIVRLRWLGPDEGGFDAAPKGPRHAAMARFAAPGMVVHEFGVMLDLGPDGLVAGLRVLDAENLPEVVERIRPRERLLILEGSRVVAEAEVQLVAGLEPPPEKDGA